MDDLISRLRALSRHEHSDYSIGDEAADMLEAAQAERKVVVAEALKYADKSGRLEAHAERLAEALRHMVSEAIDGGHNYMTQAIKDSGASELLRDQGADSGESNG